MEQLVHAQLETTGKKRAFRVRLQEQQIAKRRHKVMRQERQEILPPPDGRQCAALLAPAPLAKLAGCLEERGSECQSCGYDWMGWTPVAGEPQARSLSFNRKIATSAGDKRRLFTSCPNGIPQ